MSIGPVPSKDSIYICWVNEWKNLSITGNDSRSFKKQIFRYDLMDASAGRSLLVSGRMRTRNQRLSTPFYSESRTLHLEKELSRSCVKLVILFKSLPGVAKNLVFHWQAKIFLHLVSPATLTGYPNNTWRHLKCLSSFPSVWLGAAEVGLGLASNFLSTGFDWKPTTQGVWLFGFLLLC